MTAKLKLDITHVASNSKTGVMSAEDQIKFFKGWIYAAGHDRFVKSEPKTKHGIVMLKADAFDRLLGGHLLHLGWLSGEAEFTTSASYAFTHSRVASFPRIILPELESCD